MKFSKHEQHFAQHIEQKVMTATGLNWSERIAYAAVLIAQAADREGEATKADLATVLNHGLAGLVSKGLMTKDKDGNYEVVMEKQPEPGKIAIEEA